MRFTPTILPPIPPVVDQYTIGNVQQSAAPRAVQPAASATYIARREAKREDKGVKQEPEEEHRQAGERRRVCRRIYNIPVLIDLRSGEDRRHNPRREEDPMLNVDRKV